VLPGSSDDYLGTRRYTTGSLQSISPASLCSQGHGHNSNPCCLIFPLLLIKAPHKKPASNRRGLLLQTRPFSSLNLGEVFAIGVRPACPFAEWCWSVVRDAFRGALLHLALCSDQDRLTQLPSCNPNRRRDIKGTIDLIFVSSDPLCTRVPG
jgi:hypothetical protein